MRALIRLIVWVFLSVVLTTAVFQGGGRLLLYNLHAFEPTLNHLLTPLHVQVSGLFGSWRHLNPVIKVKRLVLPGARVNGVQVEIDVLESLFRNRLIAHSMVVKDLSLALTRHLDGSWSLLGQSQASDLHFDVLSFLKYSNQLLLKQGVVRLVPLETNPASVSALDGVRVKLAVINDRGHHQGMLQASVLADACRDCGFKVSYDLEDREYGLVAHKLAGNVVADVTNFVISKELGAIWSVSGSIPKIEGRWRVDESVLRGNLVMQLTNLIFPAGSVADVGVDVFSVADFEQGKVNARVKRLTFQGVDRHSVLKDISVSASDMKSFLMQIPELNVAATIDLLKSVMAKSSKTVAWLEGLGPKGALKDTTLRWSLPKFALDYRTHVKGVSFDAYKGAPQVDHLSGTAVGTEYAAILNLDSQDMYIRFGKLFKEGSKLQQASGVLNFNFHGGRLGIRGEQIAISLNETEARGGFALAAPKVIKNRQLTLALSVKNISIPGAKKFIPVKLPGNLRPWLIQNLLGGQIESADVVYNGYVIPKGIPAPVQIEMEVDLANGKMRFHRDWPIAEGMQGHVVVGNRLIKAYITKAETLSNSLSNLTLELPKNLAFVKMASDVNTNGPALLAYVRRSPLIKSLPFLKPVWQIEGPVNVALQGVIPIQDSSRKLQVSMQVDLGGANLLLPDMNLELTDVRGDLNYQYPYKITSEELTGQLFESSARFGIKSPNGRIDVQLDGATKVSRILQWLKIEDSAFAEGSFDYRGTLSFFPDQDRLPRLQVSSDLVGVEISLPGELGKRADQPSSMRLTYQANPILDEVSFSQGSALRGWLQLQQAKIVRGAVGINQSPARVDGSSHQIIVTGSLPRVSSDFKSSTDNPFLDLDWRLVDFRIDQIALEDGVYNNVILNGQGTPDSSIIHINADDISGEFSFHRGKYPDIDIASIRFPASQTEEVDPLADVDLAFLRPSDVSITKVVVGEENYGSWNFKLRRNGSGWRFSDLVADIKGVHIESPEGVIWQEPQGKEEKSLFSGKLSASNLAEVLPQWGYAPSVESKTMELVTSLDWPGSPLAIAMTTIAGPASLKVNHGRFLDVDSANNILRIFSLINFTAIVKRIALDFSDVFGKGISFDSITADVAFKEGMLTFQSPMEVQGTGSRFRVNGTVNLATGALNNDMIVTLPVNRSLPWYAGFLALANPLAGAGVLVGERIFRNQLELFSSAKYSVAGTWDNPEVNLVSIFTKDMKDGNTDGTKNGKPIGKKKQVVKKAGATNNREKIPAEDKTDGNR